MPLSSKGREFVPRELVKQTQLLYQLWKPNLTLGYRIPRVIEACPIFRKNGDNSSLSITDSAAARIPRYHPPAYRFPGTPRPSGLRVPARPSGGRGSNDDIRRGSHIYRKTCSKNSSRSDETTVVVYRIIINIFAIVA